MFCKSDNPNSIPGSENSNCMLCLSFTDKTNFSHSVELVEILSDVFKVLCIYMKWAPPSKFLYNFSTDLFPFCKECRLLVARLYKYDKMLLEIQQRIDTLASQISSKILDSRNCQGNIQHIKPSEIIPDQCLTDILNDAKKSEYYRSSICNRYSPMVRLISDPTLQVQTESGMQVAENVPKFSLSEFYNDTTIANTVIDEDDKIMRNGSRIEVEENKYLSDSKYSETCNSFPPEDEDAEEIINYENDLENNAENIKKPKKSRPYNSIGLEPFLTLKDRVTIVGDYQFLLDNKCLFECSETQFKCISCDLLFEHKYGLKRHLNDCPGNPSEDVIKSYKHFGNVYDEITSGDLRCRRCKYLGQSRNTMVWHMRKFHSRKKTTKEKLKLVCMEVELNKYLCNQKYPFEFKEEKFICGTCPSDFSTRSEVLLHIQREHIWVNLKKKIKFEKISRDKFAWTDPFKKTFSFEKVGNTCKCNECSYSHASLRCMKEHVRNVHIDEGSSVCKICGKIFYTKSLLKEHLNTHKDYQPFMCELCGQSYKGLWGLKIHKAEKHQNTSEKKHKCEKCGRVFGSVISLKVHERSHQFCVCHVCGKNIQLTYLDTHLLTHEKGEGKFECKKCFKKFRHSTSLYIHSKCHDGAKPYSCDICGMKFTQSYSVTRHKNVVHKANKATKPSVKPRKSKQKADVSSDEDE